MIGFGPSEVLVGALCFAGRAVRQIVFRDLRVPANVRLFVSGAKTACQPSLELFVRKCVLHSVVPGNEFMVGSTP